MMYIKNKIAMDMEMVPIVTHLDANNLFDKLKHSGFGVRTVNGKGGKDYLFLYFLAIKNYIE